MGLKLVDITATKRFVRGTDEEWINGVRDAETERVEIPPHPDDAGDDAWVECRIALSKAEDAQINDLTTSERSLSESGQITLKPAKQLSVDPAVFRIMVVAWQLSDPPKVDQYERLDAGDAEWIDSCIRRSIDLARKVTEGNSTSPGKADQPSDLPNSSDEAAGQK